MSDAGRAPYRRLTLLVPGDLDTATGGYRYDRMIVTGLRALGWQVKVCQLHDSFPQPTAAALLEAEAELNAIADDDIVVIDGLALGALPELAARHAQRLRLIGLVHHPLAQETGLSEQQALALFISERAALRAVRRVVVTSAETAAALQHYDVAASQISIIEPGVDRPANARPHSGRQKSALSLLCVATLTPRKDHAALVQALAQLPHRDWQLHCLGSITRAPETTAALQSAINAAGLTQHILLHGEVDAGHLSDWHQTADLLVQTSRHEGYGMALAEALAQGLPVLSTATGAAPRLLAQGAGLLVPVADPQALQAALRRLWDEPQLLSQLGQAAWQARSTLPEWPSAAKRWDEVLRA